MVIIHTNPNNRKSWSLRSREVLNVDPSLKHYRCYHLVDKDTKATLYLDTVEFCHSYTTQPTVTPEDRNFHAINLLSFTLRDVPTMIYHFQMDALKSLQELFFQWKPPATAAPNSTLVMHKPPPRVHSQRPQPRARVAQRPQPRVPRPMVPPQPPQETPTSPTTGTPIPTRTCSNKIPTIKPISHLT